MRALKPDHNLTKTLGDTVDTSNPRDSSWHRAVLGPGGGVFRTEDRANIVRSPKHLHISYLSVLAVESRATFGPHFPIPVSHLQPWGPRHGSSLRDTQSRRGKTLSREVRTTTRRHACNRNYHGGARVSTSATLRITTRP